MTTTLENPKQEKKGEKVRVLGTIIKEPERKTSKSGNEYTSLVVATSNGLGKERDVVWNITVMEKLRSKLPEDLFRKFAYAKFNGLGTVRPYTTKDGRSGISHDLFCDSVTMADGAIIYQNELKKTEDEDAPF